MKKKRPKVLRPKCPHLGLAQSCAGRDVSGGRRTVTVDPRPDYGKRLIRPVSFILSLSLFAPRPHFSTGRAAVLDEKLSYPLPCDAVNIRDFLKCLALTSQLNDTGRAFRNHGDHLRPFRKECELLAYLLDGVHRVLNQILKRSPDRRLGEAGNARLAHGRDHVNQSHWRPRLIHEHRQDMVSDKRPPGDPPAVLQRRYLVECQVALRNQSSRCVLAKV